MERPKARLRPRHMTSATVLFCLHYEARHGERRLQKLGFGRSFRGHRLSPAATRACGSPPFRDTRRYDKGPKNGSCKDGGTVRNACNAMRPVVCRARSADPGLYRHKGGFGLRPTQRGADTGMGPAVRFPRESPEKAAGHALAPRSMRMSAVSH